MTAPALTTRARNLLTRLRAGKFLPVYDSRRPAALDELRLHNLVATTGRVEKIRLCWVPASGYLPYLAERFASDDADALAPCPFCLAELRPSADPRMAGMLEHPPSPACPASALHFIDTPTMRAAWNRRAI